MSIEGPGYASKESIEATKNRSITLGERAKAAGRTDLEERAGEYAELADKARFTSVIDEIHKQLDTLEEELPRLS